MAKIPLCEAVGTLLWMFCVGMDEKIIGCKGAFTRRPVFNLRAVNLVIGGEIVWRKKKKHIQQAPPTTNNIRRKKARVNVQ